MGMEGFSSLAKRSRVQRGTGSGGSNLKYQMTEGSEQKKEYEAEQNAYIIDAVAKEKVRIEKSEDASLRSVKDTYLLEYEKNMRTGTSDWTNTSAALKTNGYYVTSQAGVLDIFSPIKAADIAFGRTVPGYEGKTDRPFLSGEEDSYDEYWKWFNREYSNVIRDELKSRGKTSLDDLMDAERNSILEKASNAGTEKAVQKVILPIVDKLEDKGTKGVKYANSIKDRLYGSTGGEITQQVWQEKSFLGLFNLPGTGRYVYQKTYPTVERSAQTGMYEVFGMQHPIGYQEEQIQKLRTLKQTNPLGFMVEKFKSDIGPGGTLGLEGIPSLFTMNPQQRSEAELKNIYRGQEATRIAMEQGGPFNVFFQSPVGEFAIMSATGPAIGGGFGILSGAVFRSATPAAVNIALQAGFLGLGVATTVPEIQRVYKEEGPERAFGRGAMLGLMFYGGYKASKFAQPYGHRLGAKKIGAGRYEKSLALPGYKEYIVKGFELSKTAKIGKPMSPFEELPLSKVKSLKEATPEFMRFGRGFLTKKYAQVGGSTARGTYGLKESFHDIDLYIRGGFAKRTKAVKMGKSVSEMFPEAKLTDVHKMVKPGEMVEKLGQVAEVGNVVGIEGGGKAKVPQLRQLYDELMGATAAAAPPKSRRFPKDVIHKYDTAKVLFGELKKTGKISDTEYESSMAKAKWQYEFEMKPGSWEKMMLSEKQSKRMYPEHEFILERLVGKAIPEKVSRRWVGETVQYGKTLETGAKAQESKAVSETILGKYKSVSTKSLLSPVISHYPYSKSRSKSSASLYSSSSLSRMLSSSSSRSSRSKSSSSKSSISKSISSKSLYPSLGLEGPKLRKREEAERTYEHGYSEYVNLMTLPGGEFVFGKKMTQRIEAAEVDWFGLSGI
jgi:hypothetical protein